MVVMADQDDVRRLALALPGTSEAEDRFSFSVRNKDKQKGFVWAWNERIEPKKPRVPRSDVAALRVADRFEKEALLASDEEAFFTEPTTTVFRLSSSGCPISVLTSLKSSSLAPGVVRRRARSSPPSNRTELRHDRVSR